MDECKEREKQKMNWELILFFVFLVWELVAKQKPFREIDPLDLGILIRYSHH
jgi:hypothetical protein